MRLVYQKCWMFWPLLLAGCASKQLQNVPQIPHDQAQAIVFVADGAGGNPTTAYMLGHKIQQKGIPLLVHPFRWTHGHGRYVKYQVDTENVHAQGKRLGQEVLSWHSHFPDKPMFLMGYSAGSAVILEATRYLPCSTVERIVLLAPAVSENHDLRPALTCSRQGVDVFNSDKDWLYLGFVTGILGTTDGHHDPAAGRHGFRIAAVCPQDAELFSRLRHHPWDPCISWTGHQGAHFGSYRPRFLEAYVLPLLQPPSY